MLLATFDAEAAKGIKVWCPECSNTTTFYKYYYMRQKAYIEVLV